MAYCPRYQVKYSLSRTSKWYKAVVKSVTDTIVEVTFTGDGSSASLQSDVLCNTKRFRYFELPDMVLAAKQRDDILLIAGESDDEIGTEFSGDVSEESSDDESE